MHLFNRNGRWVYRRRWPLEVRHALQGEFFQVALGTSDYADAERRVVRRNIEAEYFARIDQARAGVKLRESRSPARAEVHAIVRQQISSVLEQWQDGLETDLLPPRLANFDAAVVRLASKLAGESPAAVEQAYGALRSEPARLRQLLAKLAPGFIADLQAEAITPNERDIADAEDALAEHGIAAPAGDPETSRLAQLLGRGKIEALRLWQSRLTGNFGYKPVDPAFADLLDVPATPAKAELTLGELFVEFKRVKAAKWSKAYADEFEHVRRVAEDVLGRTRKLTTISASDCMDVRDVLLALPANWTKAEQLKHLTPKKAAATAQRLGLPGRKPGTARKQLNQFAMMFGYAASVDHIAKSPAAMLLASVVDPVKAADKRDAFTAQQLQALFTSPLYVGCQNDGQPMISIRIISSGSTEGRPVSL